MYKNITLEKFEKRYRCTVDDESFIAIKEDIEYCINVLNSGIDEGRVYHSDSFMQAYHYKLDGMKMVCNHLGIDVEIKKE